MNPTRRQPHPILFVNGPSLGRRGDAKSRNTRSALIRCRISEKRSTYRQEEEEESKREQLIAKRQARDRHRTKGYVSNSQGSEPGPGIVRGSNYRVQN